MSKSKKKGPRRPMALPPTDTRSRTKRMKDELERYYTGIFNTVGFYRIIQETLLAMRQEGTMTDEIQTELVGAQKAVDFVARKAFKYSQEELTRKLKEIPAEYLKTETRRMIDSLLAAREPESRLILPGAPNPALRGKLIIPKTVIDTGDPDRKLTPDDLRERGA